MYWILLVAGAVLALAYVVVKIRHNQLATSDAVFWFLFALVLIIVAVFPQIAFFLSDALGFESPANLVFLCLLVVVIYRLLSVSVESARLRSKLAQLTQAVALSQIPCEEEDDVAAK